MWAYLHIIRVPPRTWAPVRKHYCQVMADRCLAIVNSLDPSPQPAPVPSIPPQLVEVGQPSVTRQQGNKTDNSPYHLREYKTTGGCIPR